MRRIASLCIAICFFCAVAPLARGQSSADFFKDTFEQMLRNDPEYATGAGHHEYEQHDI